MTFLLNAWNETLKNIFIKYPCVKEWVCKEEQDKELYLMFSRLLQESEEGITDIEFDTLCEIGQKLEWILEDCPFKTAQWQEGEKAFMSFDCGRGNVELLNTAEPNNSVLQPP